MKRPRPNYKFEAQYWKRRYEELLEMFDQMKSQFNNRTYKNKKVNKFLKEK